MNKRKGFRRLTIVLSLLVFPFWLFMAFGITGNWEAFLKSLPAVFLTGAGTFAGIWIIYGLIVFIINGFLNNKESSCQRK